MLAHILERDGTTCVWCRREIGTGLVEATVEHVVPRIKGGPTWPENLVGACSRCNRARGHRTPADWLAECRGRGWEPDESRIVASLEALAGAISRRGGQRRARPYLAAQRRRLQPAGAG
jgi:5-methylcytosine-specific restriction endonuclease McrA